MYELAALLRTDNNPLHPVRQQLIRAMALHYLGRESESASAIGKAEQALSSISKDKDLKDLVRSEAHADVQSWLNGLKGNAEETLRWTSERKRRFKEEYGDDRYAISQNHHWDAVEFAYAGLNDQAIEELRTMFEEPGGYSFIFVDAWPQYDKLKDLPGYVALREEFGKKPDNDHSLK